MQRQLAATTLAAGGAGAGGGRTAAGAASQSMATALGAAFGVAPPAGLQAPIARVAGSPSPPQGRLRGAPLAESPLRRSPGPPAAVAEALTKAPASRASPGAPRDGMAAPAAAPAMRASSASPGERLQGTTEAAASALASPSLIQRAPSAQPAAASGRHQSAGAQEGPQDRFSGGASPAQRPLEARGSAGGEAAAAANGARFLPTASDAVSDGASAPRFLPLSSAPTSAIEVALLPAMGSP